MRALRLALLSTTLVAIAAESSSAAELTWEAPPGCPDRDALRWRIEDSLGMPIEKAAPLSFSAKVESKAANRWGVVLEVKRGDADPQRREIEAASCDELVQATSVAIALALSAESTPNESGDDAPATPRDPGVLPTSKPGAPENEPVTRAAETPKPSMPSAQPYWLAAQLGPVLDYQSLPGLAPGIGVAALLGRNALALKFGATALPERTKAVDSGPTGTFSLFLGSAAVCGQSKSAVSLRLCAGSEFGRISGSGKDATSTWTGSSGWIAPFVEVNGSGQVEDFIRVYVALATAVPLIRRDFYILNHGSIHQSAAVVERLGAGLELLWQ